MVLGVGGVFRWINDAARVVTSVGAALLMIAAVAVVAYAVLQGWRQARSPLVIVSPLGNATGDDALAKLAPGITHQVREVLVGALATIANRAKDLIEDARTERNSPIAALVLTLGPTDLLDEIDRSAQELTDSVAAVAPDTVKPALQTLTRVLLRPNGVQAAGLLQRVSDEAGRIGISITINDLRTARHARRVTLWEGEDTDVKGKALAERFHALARPAAGALACELLRHRLRPTSPPASGRLRRARALQDGKHELLTSYMTGVMYQVEARRMAPATPSFYRLSADELRKSLPLDHYRVFEALGDSLAEQARRTPTPRPAEELLRQAVRRYGDALARLDAGPHAAPHPAVERLRIETSRTLGLALLAERFHGTDAALAERAVEGLRALDGVDPSEQRDATVLYNMSCAWAVAARAGLVPGAQTKARCLLVHAFLRTGPSQGWFREMHHEPDLVGLRDWAIGAHSRLLDLRAAEDLVDLSAKDAGLVVEKVCADPPTPPLRSRRPPNRRP